MKKIIYLFFFVVSGCLMGCTDFLTPEPLATEKLSDFFNNDSAAIQAVNAAYVPLQWQLGGTYANEWFIGDVVSDDALKGGASLYDMQVVGLMENFQTTANNEYLDTFYDINYQGIFRCNFAMENINGMTADKWSDQHLKTRLIGEAKFLRALYHFRLMRVFGGIIKGDRTFNQHDTQIARSSKAEIVRFIRQDLEDAIKALPLKSEYPASELGRATKGAAQALLMRVILFDILNSENPFGDYDRVMSLGDSIIASKEYRLEDNYADIFKVFESPTEARFEKENGPESVFEIQYMEEATSDYGGLGRTRGNFDPIMTRTRANNSGWGFNRPTQDLYDEFEPDDIRRDEAILPFDAGDVYAPGSYDNGYHARKAALGFWRTVGGKQVFYMPPLKHPTRAPNNTIVIRYADVILMYAEAACEINNIKEGKDKLNLIRLRARNSASDPTNPDILPDFPYGSYVENQVDLRKAIRHERRVEFAMEGHRWFDLIRWGIAGDVMNAYREKYIAKEGKDMSPFIKGKHELFPIPETQLNANPLLQQNPGY
ncbi:MAG TPA: RagB/SusD family nutrient uptake outer membrane protein [Paludibacteraceae bacterium]|nr:RagB/SusD family nutrient uptake outer membrane protein [Paludibacteraceae bacterium]